MALGHLRRLSNGAIGLDQVNALFYRMGQAIVR